MNVRIGQRGAGYVLFLVVVALATLIVLASCAPISPDADTSNTNRSDASESDAAMEALRPVKLGVGFIPNVQFATFYAGIEKGFYADEGLDVSLEYGFENDYLKLVGTDELQFMIGSGDQVVIGRAQGLPVQYVMTWYTRFPVVLFAGQDSDIREPADLAGKRIGIPGPFGASYVAYRGILKAGGLTERDVQTESIGFTQAAAFSAGSVDAAVDYGVNGPVVLAHEGIETVQLSLDEHVRIPANGLVTNEVTISEEPELVGKMVRATLRANQFVLENPDEAFEIALKYVPEAGGENSEINRAVFDAVLPYWQPVEGEEAGASRLEEWAAVAALVQEIGLVDTLVPAEEMFTNDFLP